VVQSIRLFADALNLFADRFNLFVAFLERAVDVPPTQFPWRRQEMILPEIPFFEFWRADVPCIDNEVLTFGELRRYRYSEAILVLIEKFPQVCLALSNGALSGFV